MNDLPAPPDDSTPQSTRDRADIADQWKALFEEIRPGLQAFLRSRLSQSADVEDCLQSVSVTMLEKGLDVAPPARRAWLFQVAANEAAKFWRKKATTQRVLEKQATYTTESTDPDPADCLSLDETNQEIQSALRKLPTDWQTIIRMRIHDGMTFQAIADELNIPLGTALTQMRRGLQRIREQIEPE
ncbi:RNA polymerase sigma factor [Stieleria varia]|uniref:ECF RNA polymerase sigma factor RpoE n=1 Tax=Stieleria varia TaxID=2528005 RepID=A0A5C6ALH7_9BACT|nr:RNA polymerase sigma factor [Stieleria varia]TWU00885.1 ECF RNA polymerase sigma factor RpoE [Stieleria varia]